MASEAYERMVRTAHEAGCPADLVVRLAGRGIVFSPRQFVASAAACACDHPDGPTRVLYGGARMGGKSFWSLSQLTYDCMRFAGLKALFLRKVGKAARESFEDMRRVILANIDHHYDRQGGAVTFPNGSRILLGNFNYDKDVEKYLGIEYDVVAVEEATMLSSERLRDIRTCCRTSKVGWRPRMYYTTNPGGLSHQQFLREFITPHRRREEGETRFIPATVDDNPAANVDYKRNLETLTGWKLRAWRYGDWDIAAGQFFTNFVRGVHVVDAPKPQPNWTIWGAIDYGFTHYTSAYIFGMDGDGLIYILGEHGERRWLVERHAQAIKSLADRVVGGIENVERWVAGADVFAQRGTTKTIAGQYHENGITLTPADNDRVSGAARMLQLLGDPLADPPVAPRMFIDKRCVNLIETLPLLQHNPQRPEDILKTDCDEDGVGGDDWYDAARYGVMVPTLSSSGLNPLAGYRG